MGLCVASRTEEAAKKCSECHDTGWARSPAVGEPPVPCRCPIGRAEAEAVQADIEADGTDERFTMPEMSQYDTDLTPDLILVLERIAAATETIAEIVTEKAFWRLDQNQTVTDADREAVKETNHD
jgi:hypothetical protein